MAAALKSYFRRANYRFLPRDQVLSKDSMIFELDESDVWNSAVLSPSPESRKPDPKISRKSMAAAAAARGGVTRPASMPIKIPDWSKMFMHEGKENRRIEFDGDDYVEDGGEKGNRLPPHEFLARNRIASLSVHEGIGRTLKGRDLSRVRNAIWQKTGFQD
ncbi:hypothetical protein OROHE_014066 [Orobanche hederae]